MRPESSSPADDEMREEYDLRGGVRGKYYQRYRQGTNIVLLEPDLAEVFHDSETVNRALRLFLADHGAPPKDEHVTDERPQGFAPATFRLCSASSPTLP